MKYEYYDQSDDSDIKEQQQKAANNRPAAAKPPVAPLETLEHQDHRLRLQRRTRDPLRSRRKELDNPPPMCTKMKRLSSRYWRIEK